MCMGLPGRAREARGRRGYTLVELLVVIAMIGVLASIGLVGYRKYVTSAESSEAITVIQSIRAAEEVYKQETLSYLGCSPSLTAYYPQTTLAPDNKKWHWVQPGHPQFSCWQMLSVGTDKGVRFGYAVVAGKAGDAVPATSLASPPAFPNPTEPWYVVQAAGDRDDDLTYALLVASSFAFASGSNIAVENDSE
jgi:type IV pilus assembly protein PilA